MIPSILERIESMMGYKAVKNIKIKQGRIKYTKNNIKINKNKISGKDNKELQLLIKNIENKKLKENIKKFSNSFFTNLK
tara:strand:- start:12648 stop:12884 length:237 start_codon:yes stop_codon:yes gene_type:complete